jgi:mannonate dehydratase
MKVSRRNVLQGSVATLVGAGAGTALPASGMTTKTSNNKGCFYFCELLGSPQSNDVAISKQVGVNYVITGGDIGNVRKEQYVEQLQKVKASFEAVGMKIAGIEGHPVPFEKIKLGLDGRDEEIENTKWAIEALSKVGINMICYNFMAGLGWTRTNQAIPYRGGALTSGFDLEAAKAQGLTRYGEVSEEKIWANAEYFVKAVMPVAEKFKVKMALHPDDPPISPLRGIGRILTSRKAYERVMDFAPGPMNGVTFCQANFKLMGEDIYALAKLWCERNKIFFVHFRDVEGTKVKFNETFHDNGPTDMIRMLEIYSKAGFVGPIRPDHAPALSGEAQNGRSTGYTIGGKVLAFGYMRGIMDSLGLKYV